MEPIADLKQYRSNKIVRAGRIAEVSEGGCYVQNAGDADAILHFRAFAPNMTSRYTPVVGDYWVVYEDGYQSISPREPFENGYVAI